MTLYYRYNEVNTLDKTSWIYLINLIIENASVLEIQESLMFSCSFNSKDAAKLFDKDFDIKSALKIELNHLNLHHKFGQPEKLFCSYVVNGDTYFFPTILTRFFNNRTLIEQIEDAGSNAHLFEDISGDIAFYKDISSLNPTFFINRFSWYVLYSQTQLIELLNEHYTPEKVEFNLHNNLIPINLE